MNKQNLKKLINTLRKNLADFERELQEKPSCKKQKRPDGENDILISKILLSRPGYLCYRKELEGLMLEGSKNDLIPLTESNVSAAVHNAYYHKGFRTGARNSDNSIQKRFAYIFRDGSGREVVQLLYKATRDAAGNVVYTKLR